MVNRQVYDLYRADSGNEKGKKKFKINPELLSVVRSIPEGRGDGRYGNNRNRPGRGRYDRRKNYRGGGNHRGGGFRGGPRPGVPSPAAVLTRLDMEGLLPAIVSVFSRAGGAAAAPQVAPSALALTTHPRRREI